MNDVAAAGFVQMQSSANLFQILVKLFNNPPLVLCLHVQNKQIGSMLGLQLGLLFIKHRLNIPFVCKHIFVRTCHAIFSLWGFLKTFFKNIVEVKPISKLVSIVRNNNKQINSLAKKQPSF